MARERVKIEEAAAITGLPIPTLRYYRQINQGPRSYVVGRRVFYDLLDLEGWLDEQKMRSARGGVASALGKANPGYDSPLEDRERGAMQGCKRTTPARPIGGAA